MSNVVFMQRATAAILVFIWLVCPAFAWQGGDSATISCRVLTGNPHQDGLYFQVSLELANNQVIATQMVDDVGTIVFTNLPAGGYQVSASGPGFETVRISVQIFKGVSITPVTLSIKKSGAAGDAPKTAFPPVVDIATLKEGFPQKAIQDFDKAASEKNSSQAIKLLEEAVQLAPGFYMANNSLGLAYQRAKRYSDAERAFARTKELNPRAAQPRINLGGLYLEEAEARKKEGPDVTGKLLDQALDVLEEAVKITPPSALAFYLLGSANYKSSFYEEAEAALRRAVELDPKVGMSRLLLANIASMQQKWQEALDQLDAFIKEKPDAPDIAAIRQLRANIAKQLKNQGK
jgi:cytochrome c-type biogenesis protein CcmH/NrfG